MIAAWIPKFEKKFRKRMKLANWIKEMSVILNKQQFDRNAYLKRV
jgi:hypothetical protein